MFKNLALKWKIMSILVVVAPVIAGVTLYLTMSFTGQMRDDASRGSVETAYRLANKIEADMSAAMVAARTFARMGEGLAGDEGAPSRANLLRAMRGFIKDHSDFLGVYYTFEPNALDGRDADYAGAEMHNEDGRFAPWIYRKDGGGTDGQACSGYAKDDAGGAWYYLPKKLGHEIVMEPWAYEMGGKSVLMVDMVVPMKKDGKFAGVAGVDFPMGTIDQFVSRIKLYDTGYAFLLSPKGTFMAHPQSEKYVQGTVNFFDAPEFAQPLKDAARNEVFKGRPFTTVINEGGDEILYTMVPVTIGRSGTPLLLGLHIPMAEVLAKASALRTNALILGAVALALLAVVMLFLARSLSVPIVQTADAVAAIAGGDLAVRLPAGARDEVGRMQDNVNNMAEELAKNMDEIRARQQEAEDKTRQAEDATREAQEARAAAENAKREGMLAAAHRLEAIVANLSGASEEIAAQTNEIKNGSEVQRDRIAATATAMEEMNATVLEVARNASETAEQSGDARKSAEEGAVVVNQTVEAMGRIQTQARDLTRSMGQLGEQAEAIGAIMNVITDIADQTNLLALNAAIEAARAGDAGRGFAVVADEVRKLAEKTMGATQEVGDSIRAIQGVARDNIKAMDSTVEEIAKATELSRRSGEMLDAIVTGVEEAADRVQSIATAAEEQSATSEEINRSVDEINAIAMDTTQAVNEAAAASDELARQAQELSVVIEDLKTQE